MITYVEIICLAIKELENEIEEWREKCKNGGIEGQQIFLTATKDKYEKLSCLMDLYHIETGQEYRV